MTGLFVQDEALAATRLAKRFRRMVGDMGWVKGSFMCGNDFKGREFCDIAFQRISLGLHDHIERLRNKSKRFDKKGLTA